MEERCVICSEIIPEGRMICPLCEYRIMKESVPENSSVKCPDWKQPMRVDAETLKPHM